MILAKALWHKGYRYRLNWKRLPGSPDIAILKYHVAIFVDGEFWHGQDWDNKKHKLEQNKEYWVEKIEENISRDQRVDRELRAMEWKPIRFWTKEVEKDLEECVSAIAELIFDQTINSATGAKQGFCD